MSNDQSNDQAGAELAITDPDTIRLFAQMASMIPTETGAAYDRILDQILNAGRWEDLDAPWETDDVAALQGHVIRVDRLERRPSDYRQGLGIFLVIHGVDANTGERRTITSGSVAVVAQLVKAYALGVLPVFVEFVVAERPTTDGYRPHHLKFHDAVTPEATHATA